MFQVNHSLKTKKKKVFGTLFHDLSILSFASSMFTHSLLLYESLNFLKNHPGDEINIIIPRNSFQCYHLSRLWPDNETEFKK